MRISSRSCRSALRILLLYVKGAIVQRELRGCSSCSTFVFTNANFELELRERASCTTFVLKNCDFAVGALGMLFAHCAFNLQAFRRSCGNVLRIVLLYLEVANVEPDLQESASRTTFVRKRCDCAAGAAGVFFVFFFCIYKLQFCSRSSGNALCVLLLDLQVANFEPKRECTSRTTFVRKNCEFRASCGSALPVLLLYLEIAILQSEL